jgi:hypothetical protein
MARAQVVGHEVPRPQPVRIIWHITMSHDGYIAGPDDTMEWAFGHGPAGPIADEVTGSTGAILAGRRWHDIAMARYVAGR